MNKLLLITVLLYMYAGAIWADDLLYSGEVAVPDQSEAERIDAVPEALIQVLQKLSGRREMPMSAALDHALENAAELVLSFRYRNVQRTSSDGNVDRELRLVVQFMQAEVDAVVQQASLPRWRQERPSVQIWAVVDDGLKRELRPLVFDYAWQAMEDVGRIRGLPISWPDLDEEEAQLVDMRLVWGGFTDYLVERGAPADGVAIVAVRREGPLWTLRWSLAGNGQHWSWRSSDQELLFALAQGVHKMADQIAAANAIAASEQGSWLTEVTIGGLNSARDYDACLAYLQSLSLINAVEVLGATPGRIRFRLQLNASTNYLVETFDQGTTLLPMGPESEYDYTFLNHGRD